MKFTAHENLKAKPPVRKDVKAGQAFYAITRDYHGRQTFKGGPYIAVRGSVLEQTDNEQSTMTKYWGMAEDGFLYYYQANQEVEIVRMTVEV